MDGFIKKPDVIQDLKEIESPNLNKIQWNKYYNSKTKTYSLDLLRDIYLVNRQLFFDVRDELILRDFKIVTSDSNKFFPNIETQHNKIIIQANSNNDNYELIDFEGLGLGNFTHRFKVSNDKFFSNIPLENFRIFNKGINLSLLKESFEINGFNFREIIMYPTQLLSKAEDTVHEASNEEYKFEKNVEQDTFISSPNIPLSIGIDEIFYESKFNVFRRFCKEVKIETLSQVNELTLEQFRNEQGVGDVKYNQVIKKLKEEEKKMKEWDSLEFKINEGFNLFDYSVNEILAIFYEEKKSLENDLLISDIYEKRIDHLEVGEKDSNLLKSLTVQLQKIKDPVNILEEAISLLSDREKKVLEMKYKDQCTLEEIGQEIGVSRERARQIIEKSLESVQKSLDKSNFKQSILLKYYSIEHLQGGIIRYEDLKHIVSSKYSYILTGLLSEGPKFFIFDEDYRLLFLREESYLTFYEYIEEIVSLLPDVLVEDELKNLLQSYDWLKPFIGTEDLLSINGYTKTGKIWSKGRVTLSVVMKLIFKNDLPKSFHMTGDGYSEIEEIATNKYNYEINSNARSLAGALNRSDDFILSGPNTYSLFDLDNYNLEIIEKCYEYCLLQLENKSELYVKNIYEEFRNELAETGIDNVTHLYSILKFCYQDDLDFEGKSSVFKIYSPNSKKESDTVRLKEFMKQNEGISSKVDIMKHFNWTEKTTNIKIANNKEIISWGTNNYRLIGSWITDTEINQVRKIIESFFNKKGYITENILFEEAKFDPLLFDFIKKESIDTPEKFRSAFRLSIPELKGNNVFISSKDSEFQSIEDLLLTKFQNGAHRKEIEEFLIDELEYKQSGKSVILDNLISNEIFVEVDLGYWMPKNKIQIEDDIVKELLNYIEEEMGSQTYIILKQLSGYRNRLPSIDLEWTPYLMRYFLLKNGFKQVEAHNKDYRTDQIILVKEDSPINFIDELVFVLLSKKYQGNWHESYVVNYLVDEGILSSNQNGRYYLPTSLYNQSKLIDVDELGRVKLKGD